MNTITEEDRITQAKLDKIKVINARIAEIEKEVSEVSTWTPESISTVKLTGCPEKNINVRSFYKIAGVVRAQLTEEWNSLIEDAKELMK